VARVWVADGFSILIGVIAALLEATVGVTVGSVAGFTGGKVDELIMRFVEFLNGVPLPGVGYAVD